MASTNTIFKKVLNVKHTVVTDAAFFTDSDGVNHLKIYARPDKWHENDCPVCHKSCPRYDSQNHHSRVWRGLDWGGTLVEVVGHTHRIHCPKHGILTADIPWAYPDSGFTREFDMSVSWLACHLPKSAVSEYMRIDWETVGRCVHRAVNEIEPDRSRRLKGLVNIGIDETSYRKGHKYMTVVINNDNNSVVWASLGHGKTVLEKFFRELSSEQLAAIRTVTADGARWITDCVNEFLPNCERCVDPFHVVEWAMEALDQVRREAWNEARRDARKASQEESGTKEHPRKKEQHASKAADVRSKASEIKGSSYVLGKAPENLTEKQQMKLEMISKSNPRLYRAYLMKEELRLLLKIKDPNEAESALRHWMWWASHSRIPAFRDLYKKIKRHKEHILNSIRLGLSNARMEAMNNKIKLIVRKSYGFRNMQNMLDMVYLVCSDLKVPLPNRKSKGLSSL